MNVTSRTLSPNLGGRPSTRLPGETDYQSRKRRGKKLHRGPLKFDAPFVAWDGEGYTDDSGAHHYMMLVASTGDYLIAPKGRSLTTEECFRLLLRVASQVGKANHVIFGGSYDTNMILGSLPKDEVKRIHRFGYTYHDSYRIESRSRKSLSIRNRVTEESIVLYDVWPFFQSSFVKTLASWGVASPEVERIVAGKAQRAVFDYANRQEILRYCRAELVALVDLCDTFRDGLREAGITVSRWDGPGAIAGALYTEHKVKTHKADVLESFPKVNRAAQGAYFGGRIEQIQFGNHDGPVWNYDINSAYPYAISTLPSLTEGRWIHSRAKSPEPSPMSLYHLEWDWSGAHRGAVTHSPLRDFYALPYREPSGAINFIERGRGWYHAPEYDLLRRYFPEGGWRVLESYRFEGTGERPFDWVQAMYDLRAQWKAEGRGAEKVLKLGLNSLYGKMVQQVGYRADRGIPPYHQLEWGGYVTSKCRAMLYEAAMTNPSSIIGFETDGIFCTEPLNVPVSKDLGGWSCEQYDGITYAQSGVYWLRKGDDWLTKYRGFDPGSISREAVLDGWEQRAPSVICSSTRFIGMGLALMGQWDQWRRWETTPRELKLWPHNNKREHSCDGKDCRPAHHLHRTSLQWQNAQLQLSELVDSEPYPLAWSESNGRYTFAQMVADRADNDLYMEDL